MRNFAPLLSFPLWGHRRPIWLDFRSSSIFITTTVCMAVFVDVFVYGVIVPVLPFYLTDSLDVPTNKVQTWILILLSLYGAAFAVVAPVVHIVTHSLRAHRVILVAAGVVLGISTVVVCVARSLPGLVCGRLLQGCATAVTWVVGQALLIATLGKEASGRAMGLVSSSMSLSLLVAPVLGGIMYDRIGYHGMYGATIGLTVLNVCLLLAVIERNEFAAWQSRSGPIDTPCATVDNPTSMAGSRIQPAVSRVCSLGPVLGTGRAWFGFMGLLMMSAQLTALDTVLPQYVERRFHFGSLGAGLVFLAPLGPVLLGSPIVGYLVDRCGPKWVATAGLALNAPVWVVLGHLDRDSENRIVPFCVLLALLGTGSSLTMTALMAEFANISYGLSTSAMAIGITIGAPWSGGLSGQIGWFTMSYSFGIVSGITAIPVAIFTEGLVTMPSWLSCTERKGCQTPTSPQSPLGAQIEKIEDGSRPWPSEPVPTSSPRSNASRTV